MARILVDNALIRPTLYNKTWKDLDYNALYNIMYNEGFLKDKIDLGFYKDERGSDSRCIYEELFFFQTLVDYFILMKDEFFHIECPKIQDILDLEDKYKVKCIRTTVLCKFGNTKLFDLMYQKLNIAIDGLDNMVEEGGTNPCIFPLIVV